MQLIDGPISFSPVNPTRVITPHYDALILTLYINNFDVHRVLIDLGRATELFHLPTVMQMKVPLSHLRLVGRILSRFNGSTSLTVKYIPLSVKAGPVTQKILETIIGAICGKYCFQWLKIWACTMPS